MRSKMMISLLLAAFALGTGCVGGSDDCTRAADKLQGCGLPTGDTAAGGCSGTSLCEANCINAATCAEITEALGGTPNTYSACDDAC